MDMENFDAMVIALNSADPMQLMQGFIIILILILILILIFFLIFFLFFENKTDPFFFN